MNRYSHPSKLFKTLAHPTRLAILDILRSGEQCVCHMEAVLGLRQAYISQQLMVLREAGLVEDRRDGWNVFYRVTLPDVYAVVDAMNVLCGAGQLTPAAPQAGCPCPKCSPGTQPPLVPEDMVQV